MFDPFFIYIYVTFQIIQDGNRFGLDLHFVFIKTSLKNFSLHLAFPTRLFLGFGEMFAEEETVRNAKYVGGSCDRHCIPRAEFLEKSFSSFYALKHYKNENSWWCQWHMIESESLNH